MHSQISAFVCIKPIHMSIVAPEKYTLHKICSTESNSTYIFQINSAEFHKSHFIAMATLISKIFGNIEHLENINFRLSGDHNSGNISHNKNIVVTCTASIFNLFHNTNITIEAKSSKIELCECANVLIFGSDNEIVFKTSSHLKFHGDGNNCSGSLNRNVKHDCNQSKSVLERNSDIKLSGNRNNVVAKDNTNLSISGDGHQIIVENADSHIITR